MVQKIHSTIPSALGSARLPQDVEITDSGNIFNAKEFGEAITIALNSTRVGRILPLEQFNGEPKKLKDFLVKLRLYLYFNKIKYPEGYDKVLFIGVYLKGKAFQQFRLLLEEILKKGLEKVSPETKILFNSIKAFK